ncbi:MAG: VCBS repeat-containing protein [Flavobacteriaceae bacterium]|nr:VCBS repeat-containing protein [Flavobacteriaceae bacterium]
MKNLESLRSTIKIGSWILLLFLFGCKDRDRLFVELSPQKSGVDFENTLSPSNSLNILEYLYFYNGGGLAMGDINNDGLPDLYFSANQKTNKLYLNKGNLKFEDITDSAGVSGKSSWNTGVAMGDVNGDGWVDIYVTAVVGINGFTGHNELFINNGDNTFTERAAEYGLNLKGFGTTAAFFDYDLDNDLDLYVLNHAVHTQESFGKVDLRYQRDEQSGDRLLRNDGNFFTDVSEEAGIYGGINAYGLGLSISDFNQDGYPDIFVGNDFHEDDYYYLNNGDGTFHEQLRSYFGHSSRFSMGNDVGDVNGDGLPDLISLDMAPEDETVLKSSEGDDTYQTLKMRTGQYGYHYQFTRNMLFINNADAPYTETALLSGVSSTDWSWSALFGDYDQDGNLDLFVSNGIPKRPNDLDYIRFVSSVEIQKQMKENKLVDQQALEMMPDGAMPNYIFKGDGNGAFDNKSSSWIPQEKSVSSATAVGDLDGDGDLDLVTNNIDAPASLYVNQTNDGRSYLKVNFNYRKGNSFGIGTKAYVYQDGKVQLRELYPNRGWQATSDATLHFGLKEAAEIDSLVVVWPDGSYQSLPKVKTNQRLTLSPRNTKPYNFNKSPIPRLFKKTKDNLGIDFVHTEDNHTDFNYQKLIPYEVSDRGPAIAIGDLNGDALDDVFLGGAKNQPASIYTQMGSKFIRSSTSLIDKDSLHETISTAYLGDAANSQFRLIVAHGGNTVSPSRMILQNKSYSETNGTISSRPSVETSLVNTSVIVPMFETAVASTNPNPIFVGNHSKPLDFGAIPPSYLVGIENEPLELQDLGMVTDAVWDDFDRDGTKELIVVGEWMVPKFFKMQNGTLNELDVLKDPVSGLWESIIPFDIDHDGDTDYLLGNWGLNTKFKASRQFPMKMYYADFDDNGTTETIVAIEKDGNYYPLLGLNELAEQLVFLRKKFPSFKEFAGKTMEQVFGPELLAKARIFEVNTLTSGFLRNTDNTFTFEAFNHHLQIAPILAFEKYDFEGLGKESILAGGNYFGIIPFHGRLDSFSGALIRSEDDIVPGNKLGLNMEHKSVRHLKVFEVDGKPYLIIVNNNAAAEIYEINRK